MANPLLNNGGFPQGGNNGQFTINPQVKSIIGMLKNSGNPTAVLQQVAKKNPQVAQMMNMLQGQNPQEVFYAMCKERGIDPQSVLSQIQ